MITKRPWIRWALAFSAVVASVILTTYLASLHGMLDYTRDYLPLRRNFYILLGIGLLTFVALAADILERRSRGVPAAITGALTWSLTVLTLALTMGLAAYVFLPMFGGRGDTKPQLTMTGQGSANGVPGLGLAFYTDQPARSTVVWGKRGGKLSSAREARPTRSHWIKLTGLVPDTEYMYAVDGDRPVWFRTPPADEPLWFAAGGDPHVGNETSDSGATRDMLEQIAKPSNGYDAFFLLGDYTQLGFHDALWRDAAGIFTPYTGSVPTAVLPGNHDTIMGGLPFYRKYQSPDNGALWQRIDMGSVHFILLDLEWELQTMTEEQFSWLTEELNSIPKDDWTIVMSHTFYYASGAVEDGWPWYDNKTVIAKLEPVFKRADVDIVISGHKHQNELLKKDGITYVITGAFGGAPDTLLTYKSPASVWLKQGSYAFADVTINGRTATISFMDRSGKSLYRTTIKG